MHDYTLVVIAAFAHSAMENDGHAMMRERIAHMERVGMSSDEPNGQHKGIDSGNASAYTQYY